MKMRKTHIKFAAWFSLSYVFNCLWRSLFSFSIFVHSIWSEKRLSLDFLFLFVYNFSHIFFTVYECFVIFFLLLKMCFYVVVFWRLKKSHNSLNSELNEQLKLCVSFREHTYALTTAEAVIKMSSTRSKDIQKWK